MANIEITPKPAGKPKVKVLVCITPQVNSKRLIDFGVKTSREIDGETHILYVQKGQNIFMADKTPSLLQELFDYGAENNGIIHAECGVTISDTIRAFIRKEKITHAVLGAHMPEFDGICEDVVGDVRRLSPYVEVIILERE